MQTQLPVIRTYTGPDRAAAQEAYRRDAQQALLTGWHAVAHRWRVVGGQHELAVVFQPADAASAGPMAETTEDTAAEPALGAETPVDAPETPLDEPMAEAEPETADEIAIEPEVAIAEAEPEAAMTEVDVAAAPETADEVPIEEPIDTPPAPSASRSLARSRARLVVETIDLHAGGEPLRLIRSGYPRVPAAPILERRRWAREHADSVRRALIHEPRGHRDMYGAVLLPAHRPDADIAVLFLHNEGYSTMCGHGILALATGLIEEGLYPATTPQTVIRWETPAGLVTSTSDVAIGPDDRPRVTGVRFRNVPAYLHARDLLVPLGGAGRPGVAAVRAQLAFGGAYYGIVDAAELGLRVSVEQVPQLRALGAAITERLRADHTPAHPTEPDLGFVYGAIVVDRDPASVPDGLAPDADIRSLTVFADAEVDRSPCGSGTSALLAWLHATGQRAVGDGVRNASVTGSVFEGRLEATTTLGDREALETSIAGSAFVTGYHTFVVDDRDPLGDGFLLP